MHAASASRTQPVDRLSPQTFPSTAVGLVFKPNFLRLTHEAQNGVWAEHLVCPATPISIGTLAHEAAGRYAKGMDADHDQDSSPGMRPLSVWTIVAPLASALYLLSTGPAVALRNSGIISQATFLSLYA